MTTPVQTPDLSAGMSQGQSQAQPQQQSSGIDLSSGMVNPSSKSGEGQDTNMMGNTVVVPKEGETYQDTVHRAVGRVQAETPEQQQAELARNTPAKLAEGTAETLGGAAAAGVAGPAALAGAGSLPAVVPGTIAGLKAIGTWAEANPVHAYLLLQALKEFVPGFRKMTGIVDKSPTQ